MLRHAFSSRYLTLSCKTLFNRSIEQLFDTVSHNGLQLRYPMPCFPVIPHINCSIGAGSCLRKSTQPIPSKKMGSFGCLEALARITGMTEQPRFTNLHR